MFQPQRRSNDLRSPTWRAISVVPLVLSLILSGFTAPISIEAGAVSDFSDTISDPRPGVGSNHNVTWTSTTTIAALETIVVQFDPRTDAFDLSGLTTGDISGSGFSVVGSCTPAPSEVVASIDASEPGESVTLTVCGSDSIPVGTLSLTIGGGAILNPASTGSYVIRLGGTQSDFGDTRVAIIDGVTLDAAVETTLTFSIAGLTSGSIVNTETMSTTTSSTAIAFGLLEPSTPVTGGQEITVTTNATAGFAVTVREDSPFASGGGADIDVFHDGGGNPAPALWTPPSGLSGQENSYGHYGITTDDADLEGGAFIGARYVGNFATTSRVIFSNDGPADGSTQNIGKARVAYRIEISGLQEAGSDYTNRLIYVCTPSF